MQEPTKRAAIHARIATPPQTKDLDPLTFQIEAARHYGSEKGYAIDESHVYQEVLSGSEYKNRPQLSLLFGAAKQGAFDVLVVFALNRPPRNPADVAILLPP